MRNKNTIKNTSSSFLLDSTSLLIILPSPPPQATQGRIGGGDQFLRHCPHHSFLLTLFPCSMWCPSHRILGRYLLPHGPSWAAEGRLNTAMFSESCRGIPAPLSGLCSLPLFHSSQSLHSCFCLVCLAILL